MPYADKAKKQEWERANRSGGTQKKIWWGYLYPESAPADWLNRIRESGYEVLAMLHDKDVTAAGEVKKEHVHVAVRFDHAQNAKTAKKVLTEFGVLEASVQSRDSWRAVARYMCHMDDPDKYQYNPDDVIEVGGADYFDAISRSSDKYRIICEMQDYIDEHSIMSFAEFNRYCRAEHKEWFYALCDNCAVIIREYIKSCRYDYLDTSRR